MFQILQIVSALVVTIAVAQSLAHARELPGKLRLGKEQYFAVQQISAKRTGPFSATAGNSRTRSEPGLPM